MSPTVVLYVSQAIHGLAYGMLLFLVASGLTMIFGMMGILNIAHASFFMLAGYFCYTFIELTGNFWVAIIVAPLTATFFGLLVERFLLRKAHAQGHLSELLLTLGIAMVILEGVKLFWGTEEMIIKIPQSLSGFIHFAGISYPTFRLFIIILSTVILVIMGLVLYTTRLGMIVRAAVSDADMVNVLGINMPLVFMVVFGFGTWMAGMAGVAAAPMLTVFPGMAEMMLMDCFVVVVIGGFGSLGGALLASLLIGELHSFGIQFIPRLAPVLVFAFMAIVLSFRPRGLFGER